MRNQNQPVATEGYPFIGVFAYITLVFAVLGWSCLTLLLLGLTLFTVYFFRNPDCILPREENAVVAPAEGKVIFVGEVMEEMRGPVVKTSITTAVAFFALMLARVRGMRELGLICGVGMILTLMCTLVMLPALVALVAQPV